METQTYLNHCKVLHYFEFFSSWFSLFNWQKGRNFKIIFPVPVYNPDSNNSFSSFFRKWHQNYKKIYITYYITCPFFIFSDSGKEGGEAAAPRSSLKSYSRQIHDDLIWPTTFIEICWMLWSIRKLRKKKSYFIYGCRLGKSSQQNFMYVKIGILVSFINKILNYIYGYISSLRVANIQTWVDSWLGFIGYISLSKFKMQKDI